MAALAVARLMKDTGNDEDELDDLGGGAEDAEEPSAQLVAKPRPGEQDAAERRQPGKADARGKRPEAAKPEKMAPVSGGDKLPVYSAPRPSGTTNANWVSDVLVMGRGVMSAFGCDVLGDDVQDNQSRILSIDASKVAGRSWWWLWKARGTRFQERNIYRVDRNIAVYRTQLDDVEWLPTQALYEGSEHTVCQEAFEQATAMGITVAVHEYSPLPPCKLEIHEQMSYVGPQVLMELDAAAAGIAPAILAITLVFDNDDYIKLRSKADLEATSTADMIESTRNAASKQIVGMISVTQYHSYQLSDMLQAREGLGPADNHAYADRTIFELGEQLSRKMRRLASLGYMKLNMTPETVVCVPNVKADPDDPGQWKVVGFKFDDRENPRDVFEGEPMLWDFDPRFVKRIALGKSDFDADCSYAVMSLVLLASARAEFGTAYLPLCRQFMGQDVDGNHIPNRAEHAQLWLPEVFARIRAGNKYNALVHFMRSWRPTYMRQPDTRLKAAFEEVARDFAMVVRSDLLRDCANEGGSPFDATRPLFKQLLCYVIQTSELPVSLFAPAMTAEEAEHRDQARRDRARLLTVCRAQRDRWMSRAVAVK